MILVMKKNSLCPLSAGTLLAVLVMDRGRETRDYTGVPTPYTLPEQSKD